jgi:hypothetical protein
MSSIIRAEIVGDDTAVALGVTAHAPAPVLKLCTLLIEAGHDPAMPLHAYRGDMLCLKVRSIGEGARLECNHTGFRLTEVARAARRAA